MNMDHVIHWWIVWMFAPTFRLTRYQWPWVCNVWLILLFDLGVGEFYSLLLASTVVLSLSNDFAGTSSGSWRGSPGDTVS